MRNYLIVFLGAGTGGAMRYSVNMFALKLLGTGFPFGTLAVNILGSLLMGVLFGLFSTIWELTHAGMRLFLATGVLGGFTTFSAFSLDAALLYEQGHLALAMGYIVASVGLALAGLFLGMALARYFS